MHGTRTFIRQWILCPLMFALISGSTLLQAAPPTWWSEGNPPVIDPNAAANNHGVANIGQAKWMAKHALAALRQILPQTADAIEADLVGAGKPIATWDGPTTPGQQASQRAPLLIGQLKAIAAPFYARLHVVAPQWLTQEAGRNNVTLSTQGLPWTVETTDDANRSVALIGQLKAVFSLDFAKDYETPGDGLSDLWEYAVVNANPNDAWTSIGGINLGNAGQAGTSTGTGNPPGGPQQPPGDPDLDTDGDGLVDSEDCDPNDAAVCWKKVADGSFAVIELTGMPEGAKLRDLGEGGHVLAGAGVMWGGFSMTTEEFARYHTDFVESTKTLVWNPATSTWSANLPIGDIYVVGTSIDADGNVYGNGSIDVNHEPGSPAVTLGTFPYLMPCSNGAWGSPSMIGTITPADADHRLGYASAFLCVLGGRKCLTYGWVGELLGGDAHIKVHEAGSDQVLAAVPVTGSFYYAVGEANGWYMLSAHDPNFPQRYFGCWPEGASGAIASNAPPTAAFAKDLARIDEDLALDGKKTAVVWVDSERYPASTEDRIEAPDTYVGYRNGGAGGLSWIKSQRPVPERLSGIVNGRGEGLSDPEWPAAVWGSNRLWRNGSWRPLNDMVDAQKWTNVEGVDINDKGMILAYADKTGGGTRVPVLLVPVEIVPDANRDGKITREDSGKITPAKPWRFWMNDDDDSGETGGGDVPRPWPQINLADGTVNGIRDLVDFFPVKLEIKTLLQLFPPSSYQYYLRQDYDLERVPAQWGKSGLGYVEWPEADPAAAPGAGNAVDAYLRNIDTARQLASRPVVPVRENPLSQGTNQGGQKLSPAILSAAEQGKGLLLIEGKNRTSKPLILQIYRQNGDPVCDYAFPVSISSVDEMLRYKFVMPAASIGAGDIPGDPPNWPDAERNSQHFVFVHGYNVNPEQSKGWAAEFFKRLFWSGSNARFSAFAWYGYQSQTLGAVSPDYQVNLDHAFATAQSFKQFLDLLPGDKTVAAHSMGNILVGSAMHDWGARPKNYLMLNSAAAKECYDVSEADDSEQEGSGQGGSEQDEKMVHPAWKDYPKYVRASEWHALPWLPGDGRSQLTWKGRLRGVIANGGTTQVYNFYSSGEEVLNNPEVNNPDPNSDNGSENGTLIWAKANKMWAMQEKRKGLGLTGVIQTSNYAGWKFNRGPYHPDIHVLSNEMDGQTHRMKSPAELPPASLPANFEFMTKLQARPFFDDSHHVTLFDPAGGASSSGSQYAIAHRNTLISQMVPCTTFAAGRNQFIYPETSISPSRNINMDSTMKTNANEWPLTDEFKTSDDDPPIRAWLHSDVREKAFTHNWKVYDKFIELGNLK